MNWTTRLDPALLRRHYGIDAEIHDAFWVPPQWPGKGPVAGLLIPECELQFVFQGADGEPVATINRPQHNKSIKRWLRTACEAAIKYHAAFHVTADTAEQVAQAAKLVVRLLPNYERVALERMYDANTRVRERLS
jgi:hypothetical protein